MTKIGKVSLVTQATTTDSIGQIIETETLTDLICNVRSVTQSEFMQGSQSGLAPAYVFECSIFAYSGQKVLIYNGLRYSIYRTFEADENYIELYAEQEVGVSGG